MQLAMFVGGQDGGEAIIYMLRLLPGLVGAPPNRPTRGDQISGCSTVQCSYSAVPRTRG